jgi:hypothetical protein
LWPHSAIERVGPDNDLLSLKHSYFAAPVCKTFMEERRFFLAASATGALTKDQGLGWESAGAAGK